MSAIATNAVRATHTIAWMEVGGVGGAEEAGDGNAANGSLPPHGYYPSTIPPVAPLAPLSSGVEVAPPPVQSTPPAYVAPPGMPQPPHGYYPSTLPPVPPLPPYLGLLLPACHCPSFMQLNDLVSNAGSASDEDSTGESDASGDDDTDGQDEDHEDAEEVNNGDNGNGPQGVDAEGTLCKGSTIAAAPSRSRTPPPPPRDPSTPCNKSSMQRANKVILHVAVPPSTGDITVEVNLHRAPDPPTFPYTFTTTTSCDQPSPASPPQPAPSCSSPTRLVFLGDLGPFELLSDHADGLVPQPAPSCSSPTRLVFLGDLGPFELLSDHADVKIYVGGRDTMRFARVKAYGERCSRWFVRLRHDLAAIIAGDSDGNVWPRTG
ncbi:hypothetical protein BV25DRAFT_1836809 [Artomyces pyxidatus]|uniref:Uncharacterized protein n=1 Tax=Artomyces pyxidatus TaxID=48021 RepID=A0ACB8TA23_9AGAM|nr:hypothetical protein BV25DRAFT_1836809 [Artomyces pyxidatus]